MVAQAIKDLAGHGEDFGFRSDMGGQRINKMFNGIPLTLKRVGAGPGWRGVMPTLSSCFHERVCDFVH